MQPPEYSYVNQGIGQYYPSPPVSPGSYQRQPILGGGRAGFSGVYNPYSSSSVPFGENPSAGYILKTKKAGENDTFENPFAPKGIVWWVVLIIFLAGFIGIVILLFFLNRDNLSSGNVNTSD